MSIIAGSQSMETKQLGNTKLAISAIGLGAVPMSLSTRPSESQAIQTIHRALDLGVSFIDTADSYCLNEAEKHYSEKLIGKALQHPGQLCHWRRSTALTLCRHVRYG